MKYQIKLCVSVINFVLAERFNFKSQILHHSHDGLDHILVIVAFAPAHRFLSFDLI